MDVPPKLSARVRVLSSSWQRPQERRGRCPRHRAGRLAQRKAGGGRSRGRLGGAAPALREARGPGGRAYQGAKPSPRAPAGPRPRRGGQKLSAERAARILRGIRPKGASARLRRRLASEVLRDVRTLDRKIADLNGRIEAEVEASGTTLTQIFGIGPILAARIIGTVGDVGRFPTKAHFASYSGTAPLEASSGEVVRHRLSLAGNRKLNYALHMVARMPGQVGRSGRHLLPQEDSGGQVPQGGATVPQEARLRCRLQEPRWRIRRQPRAAPLDKEEPRTV